jgi:hypothetical protein
MLKPALIGDRFERAHGTESAVVEHDISALMKA